jgi:hypothetical protein
MGALDNNLTFKLYNRSFHSNTKTNSTILKLLNENLLCRTCITETTRPFLRPFKQIFMYHTFHAYVYLAD